MGNLPSGSIILFDGICNLCNGYVDFVIRRDAKARFHFAALQSEIGKEITQKYSLPTDSPWTVILVENGRTYVKSTAVLRVLKSLPGLWPLLYALVIVPPFLRNWVYDWVARNRYRWFGKRDTCRMPTASERERFLDAGHFFK